MSVEPQTEACRVGTLLGSLRHGSYSRGLAGSLPYLAPEGMQIADLPSVGGLPHFDQDLLDAEGVPQTVADLAAAIGTLDGLVIVSPEFNWSIPGVLKNALDWLSRLRPNPLQNMPVLILTSSPGLLGGARAHPPIRNVLHALDCRILARPEIQIAGVKDKLDPDTGRLTDAATSAFVAERLAAFRGFIAA